MSFEQEFKELTADSGMGTYGLAELLGRDADDKIKELGKVVANAQKHIKRIAGYTVDGVASSDLKKLHDDLSKALE